MTDQPRRCDLDACHPCTGCAHSGHADCSGAVLKIRERSGVPSGVVAA
jgi:hypothetical protein